MLDLASVEKKIRNLMSKNYNITCEYEQEEDSLNVEAEIALKGLDTQITLAMTMDINGILVLHFFLDEIEADYSVFKKINQLNVLQTCFRVYVDDDKNLMLDHIVTDVITEDNLLEIIGWTLRIFTSDEVLEILKPLFAY